MLNSNFFKKILIFISMSQSFNHKQTVEPFLVLNQSSTSKNIFNTHCQTISKYMYKCILLKFMKNPT